MPRMPTRRTTRGLPRRQAPGYQGVFGQSLFGGSGAGTPQQFQSTQYRGNSLTGSYQHAYDQARAQNENRYNRILGGYGELLGQPSPYQAQRMNVHDLYNRRAGATHANLVGRGLTASTVGMAPQALNERERQFSLADIGDKEARYKSDIAQDQLDFMERKTEAYPDYEQLERLSQGLGAGGRGLGGGGGGGMGAAKAYQSSWKPAGGGFLMRRKPGDWRGRMEYARQHQKVGMSSFGGFGGIAANYGNPNQYLPVISPVAGGAPIEQQMFPGQYDMTQRMMTAANLRGPHQYGGSYQERRGGGAQRGMTRDQQRRANLRQEQISARGDRARSRRAPTASDLRYNEIERQRNVSNQQYFDRLFAETPVGQYEGGYAPGAGQQQGGGGQPMGQPLGQQPMPQEFGRYQAMYRDIGEIPDSNPWFPGTPTGGPDVWRLQNAPMGGTSVPFSPGLTQGELATRQYRDAQIAQQAALGPPSYEATQARRPASRPPRGGVTMGDRIRGGASSLYQSLLDNYNLRLEMERRERLPGRYNQYGRTGGRRRR